VDQLILQWFHKFLILIVIHFIILKLNLILDLSLILGPIPNLIIDYLIRFLKTFFLKIYFFILLLRQFFIYFISFIYNKLN
jgi:hypothetical protein